jgi:hypothetical protein
MKILAAVLAVALACAGLEACSEGPPRDRHVALARDLVVTLPPGSPHVTARQVHAATGSPLARPLAPAEHVAAGGRFGGQAVLTFHVGHVSGRPFLAWLDGATWVPVASTYNPKAGTVSAVVSHFSTWAPFTWVVSQIQQWVKSEIGNVLGVGTATDPRCGTSGATVTDSNPSHHTIGACAEPAQAAAPGTMIAQVANLRAYPVDLSYPASANGLCGEYGRCVQVKPEANAWLKVGAALSPGKDKILLPGSGTATVITAVPRGQPTMLTTAVDEPAMFMAFLQAGLAVFSLIIGQKVEAIKTAATAVSVLITSQCVASAWQQETGPLTVRVASSLATSAFGCLASQLPKILDKLGLKEAGLILGAFNVAVGLAAAAVSSVWGLYDAFFGSHVLTVATAACPSAAIIQQTLAQASWWRPGYTVPATDITCAGPYVAAGFLESPQVGARVLLKQEASGLKLLTTGSGPLCTTIPTYALPGQVVDVPSRYGHALDCIH